MPKAKTEKDTYPPTMMGSSHKVRTIGTDQPHKMEIVSAASSASVTHHFSASTFKLPHGWTVEKRPRRSNHSASHHSFDTYYYEPGTGRQFRSMISIQRYLNGEATLECGRNSIKHRNVNNMQIEHRTLKSSKEFNLPEGWLVEAQPRKNVNHAGHIDKYYYEPGTGRKFRSMISIQRYLNGETTLKCGRNQIKYCNMQIEQLGPRSGTEFNLPEGWLVEEQPRKNANYAGHIDKYYIEPGTKKRFRSLVSAERYLAERKGYATVPKNQKQEDQSSKIKLLSQSCAMTIVIKHPIHGVRKYKSLNTLEAGSYCAPSNDSGSQREKLPVKPAENSAHISYAPPDKIKWVLNGLGSNAWIPVVDGSPVSESVQQNWSETFLMTLNDKNAMLPR